MRSHHVDYESQSKIQTWLLFPNGSVPKLVPNHFQPISKWPVLPEVIKKFIFSCWSFFRKVVSVLWQTSFCHKMITLLIVCSSGSWSTSWLHSGTHFVQTTCAPFHHCLTEGAQLYLPLEPGLGNNVLTFVTGLLDCFNAKPPGTNKGKVKLRFIRKYAGKSYANWQRKRETQTYIHTDSKHEQQDIT